MVPHRETLGAYFCWRSHHGLLNQRVTACKLFIPLVVQMFLVHCRCIRATTRRCCMARDCATCSTCSRARLAAQCSPAWHLSHRRSREYVHTMHCTVYWLISSQLCFWISEHMLLDRCLVQVWVFVLPRSLNWTNFCRELLLRPHRPCFQSCLTLFEHNTSTHHLQRQQSRNSVPRTPRLSSDQQLMVATWGC